MRRADYAAVILLTKDGQFILQLRDDKSGVSDPGKLSLFAGRIESGESEEQAAERELFEETTIRSNSLVFWGAYKKDAIRHGREGTCFVYVLKGVGPDDVQVQEGQGYRLIKDMRDLPADDFASITYDILVAYVDSLASF